MTLYVHIGTHKTGTTSIQNFFRDNCDYFLQKYGLYYPSAGQIGSGSHHNLVWEAMGDARFRITFGNWSQLHEEISKKKSQANDILISCEAFSAYSDFSAVQKPLVELSSSLNMEMVPIVFLRPQEEFIESLYFEDIKSGIGDKFHEYLSKCLDKERFDYFRLVEGWTLDGRKPIVVPYDSGTDSIASLVSILGFNPDDLSCHYNKNKNIRLSASNLSLLLALNRAMLRHGVSKSNIRSISYAVAKQLPEPKGVHVSVLSKQEVSTIRAAFKISNDRLKSLYPSLSSIFDNKILPEGESDFLSDDLITGVESVVYHAVKNISCAK